MGDERQVIPYRSKIAYELVFLEAIKDVRAQRVNSPERGFVNAVKALELVLLPVEKEIVDKYKFDYGLHEEEYQKIEEELSSIKDDDLKIKIKANKLQGLSWHIYCKYLNEVYERGSLEDQDFNGVADRSDLVIKKYEGLLTRIIGVLKENDWLIKGGSVNRGGGGIGFEDEISVVYEDAALDG